MYAETNGHVERNGGAGNNLVNYCVDESKMSTLMRRGKAVKAGNWMTPTPKGQKEQEGHQNTFYLLNILNRRPETSANTEQTYFYPANYSAVKRVAEFLQLTISSTINTDGRYFWRKTEDGRRKMKDGRRKTEDGKYFLRREILNLRSGTYEAEHTKLNIRNWTYETEHTKLNIRNWTYEAEHTKLNIQNWTYEAEHTKLNIQSWTYEAELMKLNLRSWTYEAELTKLNLRSWTYEAELTKLNLRSWTYKYHDKHFWLSNKLNGGSVKYSSFL